MWLEKLLNERLPKQTPGSAAFWYCIVGAILACVVIFVILSLLPARTRRPIIVATTFLAGLFYAVEFFWPTQKFDGQDQNFLTFANPVVGNLLGILTSFTLGMGVISLTRVHGTNVIKRKPGWENSVVLLSAMITMTIAGLFYEKTTFYRSLFRDVLANFDAAMFAILAFFIIGAAYRAFRVRSAEATLLMASAVVVMLGQIPIGQFLTSKLPEKGEFTTIFRFESISNWMLLNVNGPAVRAINFGIGLGLLAIALRLWLSLERGAYFEAKVEEEGSAQ
jgi:hypothetical protein